MYDVYFENKLTGELKPSSEAIKEFYASHGALEAWTDEWTETNMPVEGKFMSKPDFVGALSI